MIILQKNWLQYVSAQNKNYNVNLRVSFKPKEPTYQNLKMWFCDDWWVGERECKYLIGPVDAKNTDAWKESRTCTKCTCMRATDHEAQMHVGSKHMIHNTTADSHNCSSSVSSFVYLCYNGAFPLSSSRIFQTLGQIL